MQSNQTNYFYFILFQILRKDIYIVNYRIMLITIYYLRGLDFIFSKYRRDFFIQL